MTALESLIAELREEAALLVPMVAPAALTTILDALEAAEQRAETLRGALETALTALNDPHTVSESPRAVKRMHAAIAEAERALKVGANGGG